MCTTNDSMELLYLWIGRNETGFIQEQGFNFSPNYWFELTQNKEPSLYKLTCIVNKDYPNIWKTGRIIGLTAVVGENGTGKSSLMRFIMDPDLRDRWIYVYKINDSIEIYHNIDSLEIDDTIDCEVFGERDYRTQAFRSQTRVYISNAWNSLRTSLDEEDNNFDRLVFSPDGKEKLSRLFCEKMNQNIPAYPEIRPHHLSMYSRPQKVSNIDVEELVILHYYSHLFTDDAGDIASIPQNSVIAFNFYDHFIRIAKKLCTDNDYRNFRQIHARPHNVFPCYDAYLALYLEYCVEAGIDPFQENDPVSFIEHTLFCSSKPSGMHETVWDYYREACNEIRVLESILHGFQCRGRTINGGKFITEIYYNKDDHRDTFKEFCHYITWLMYKPCSFVLKYIHIDIAPVSSGEQALRNIFSYLQLIQPIDDHEQSEYAKKSPINHIFGIHSDSTLRKNILLMLDEVDLYLHPEWQRKFLAILEERLTKAYPRHYIQLIITTHSPLVLSDIPSENVIYLEKDGNECSVVQRSNGRESFGANLFSLLKDSFFLKKSIGEFAHRKINAIISDLDDLTHFPDNTALRETCQAHRQVIDIIGEPMLRGKLLSMYEEAMEKGAHNQNHDKLALLLNRLQESDDPEDQKLYQCLLTKMNPEQSLE